jgi:hypothetical protein
MIFAMFVPKKRNTVTIVNEQFIGKRSSLVESLPVNLTDFYLNSVNQFARTFPNKKAKPESLASLFE